MASKKDNGILMLVGLVFLLSAPVVIGHFVMQGAPKVAVQASAAN